MREIPSIDALLKLPPFSALSNSYGHRAVVDCLRSVLAEMRQALREQRAPEAPHEAWLAATCGDRLAAANRRSLRPVFNLTGTVLHTNLGRALYPDAAVLAATDAMRRPVNLEYDLDKAARGERDDHVEPRLLALTGAEAAVVVNNNAAAVYLALNSVALGREVPVSRGELVEIGGSFRIPDIMAASGCVLREVGTTNRTHPHDFEAAIGERTAALMKVHTSNYEVRGFTASVCTAELVRIAHAHGIPLVEDLGSGVLTDLRAFGLPCAPTPCDAVAAGADLVTFSGDKLLGGPQCGIIVGRRDWIARIRKNPMKRALRLDKVRLAALEAVLGLYADPERLAIQMPTLRLLTRALAEIEGQARRMLPALQAALGAQASVDVAGCASQVGSGAMPVDTLPSVALRITPRPESGGRAVEQLAASLRSLPIPVIGRIHNGALWLDLRCLEAGQEAEFAAQLSRLRARETP